jgi:hypothetical protein
MESQIYSFIKTPEDLKITTLFGYATKGVPGLEVTGLGKRSKNIKEKIIYLTRTRKLKIPTRRFVLCLDINDLANRLDTQQLKHFELPTLLLFWHLAKVLPIQKLSDCVCSGQVNTTGEIFQDQIPNNLKQAFKEKLNPVKAKSIKLIHHEEHEEFWNLNSSMLLHHVPDISIQKPYMDKLSASPLNSTMV